MTKEKQSAAVILVEDNEDLNALILAEVEAAGFPCQGFHGLRDLKASGATAQVYVLDLNLPDVDGLTLARGIKAENPDARIVMLTARAGAENRIAGYEAGASAYLQKPCTAREILAAIRSNMADAAPRPVQKRETANQVATAHVTTEDVKGENVPTLSLSGRLLRGDLGSVAIGTAEQAFLIALSDAPDGLPYEKVQEIMSTDKTISLPTLEVRITRLRKKIESVFSRRECIRSVRKFGYCLGVPLQVH